MLFKLHHLEGIAAGKIDLAFRRWRRPTVKAGGTLRTRIGVPCESPLRGDALRNHYCDVRRTIK